MMTKQCVNHDSKKTRTNHAVIKVTLVQLIEGNGGIKEYFIFHISKCGVVVFWGVGV